MRRQPLPTRPDALTEREVEILRLIAAGLSNDSIAQTLVLTLGTVKWHNKHIFSKLGVRSRTQAVAQARVLGLLDSPIPVRRTGERPIRLPVQRTAFVGRQVEVAGIVERLNALDPVCRLLTLTGPGGIGKTRLAIEAATRLARQDDDRFADGVVFVPLAPLTSIEQMIPVIAEAGGFQFYSLHDQARQLNDFLGDKRLLLVLDNLEQLASGADVISTLLDAAPGLAVLATSRSTLGLHEEWVLTVSGLTFPEGDSDRTVDATEYEAVQFFVERAKRMQAGFDVEANRHWVETICRQTQGMPLAIEIAASWLRTLPCEAIAHEIERSVDFLETTLWNVPERHRSLRAVFDWSWSLLNDAQRDAFRSLSVFRGGFTREAKQTITGAPLPLLAALIEQSLITVAGSNRYDIHPLLRQYGEEHLLQDERGTTQAEAVQGAHSRYYLALVAGLAEDLKGERQLGAIQTIRLDLENIRAAWDFALDTADPERDYPLLEAAIEGLAVYDGITQEVGGFFTKGREKLRQKEGQSPRWTWGRLLICGEHTETEARQALDIAERYGDERAMALALLGLAQAQSDRNQYRAAMGCLERALPLFEAVGDRYSTATTLVLMRWCSSMTGDEARAAVLIRQASAIYHALGDRLGMATANNNMGSEAFEAGDFAEAERLLQKAVALGREIGNRADILIDLQFIGNLYLLRGDVAAAEPYYAEAMAIATNLGRFWRQYIGFVPGFQAVLGGDYERAYRRFEECRMVVGRHLLGMMLVNWGQALADLALGQYALARERTYATLKYSTSRSGPMWTILTLPVAACLLAAEGRAREAVELLGYASTHYPQAVGWFGRWEPGIQVIDRLRQALGSDAFAVAWTGGGTLKLDTIIAELLAFLAQGHADRWSPTMEA